MKKIASVVLGLLWVVSVWAETNSVVPPYEPNWKPTRDLTRFFAKLRAGKPVTVAAIGGSVTERPGWAEVATEWLRKEFPSNTIKCVNAAEGGRGPMHAIWRFRREVVAAAPDLMLIEYAVNCYGKPAENYKPLDGMVLQLLQSAHPPDMAFVYVGNKDWKPSPGWESVNVQPVGRHYGFPEVFARAHLQTKLDAGDVKWEDIARDGIHPRRHTYSDPKRSAHAIYGEAVIALLKEQMARGGDPTPLPPVPKPFYSDEWATADVIPVSAAKREGGWKTRPAQGAGKRFFDEYVECDEPGATLTVTARTTSFTIVLYPAFDGGRFAWSVDGGKEEVEFVGKGKEGSFGGVWSPTVAEGLPVGEHTLKITVHPAKEGAKGNWVRIGAFGVTNPKPDPDGVAAPR